MPTSMDEVESRIGHSIGLHRPGRSQVLRIGCSGPLRDQACPIGSRHINDEIERTPAVLCEGRVGDSSWPMGVIGGNRQSGGRIANPDRSFACKGQALGAMLHYVGAPFRRGSLHEAFRDMRPKPFDIGGLKRASSREVCEKVRSRLTGWPRQKMPGNLLIARVCAVLLLDRSMMPDMARPMA